jgi:sortase A
MKNNYRQLGALVLIIVGLGVIVFTFVPIAAYLSDSKQKFPDLISPLSKDDSTNSNIDYTRASNWFVGSKEAFFEKSEIKYYTLSIPDLEINNATVAIGGEDLSDNLIHYPGTALPGKIGNSVIFGHSILPSFFNPEDYISIFSTLSSLKKGDDVYVDFDGIRYKYVIDEMFEVTPEDVQILEQNSSKSYITLVTCTPPGDPRKPKRLIVRARLVPIS